jgi:transcriptional regulator with XRE-family HTH domain
MTRGSRGLTVEERADERAVYERVGVNIRLTRQMAGLTQQELADEVLLQRTSIANIEAGRQALSVANLLSIADALSVEPGDLL